LAFNEIPFTSGLSDIAFPHGRLVACGSSEEARWTGGSIDSLEKKKWALGKLAERPTLTSRVQSCERPQLGGPEGRSGWWPLY
jgi:hypothetical protein